MLRNLKAEINTPTSPDRRRPMRLLVGASLAAPVALIAGCGDMNMKAAPEKPRPKTHITGRGGGPGR